MPIPVEKLDEAQRSLEERVLQILRSRPDQAFSAFEVFIGIEGYDATVAALLAVLVPPSRLASLLGSHETTLQRLVLEGQVRTGVVRGTSYFASGGKER